VERPLKGVWGRFGKFVVPRKYKLGSWLRDKDIFLGG